MNDEDIVEKFWEGKPQELPEIEPGAFVNNRRERSRRFLVRAKSKLIGATQAILAPDVPMAGSYFRFEDGKERLLTEVHAKPLADDGRGGFLWEVEAHYQYVTPTPVG